MTKAGNGGAGGPGSGGGGGATGLNAVTNGGDGGAGGRGEIWIFEFENDPPSASGSGTLGYGMILG